MNDRLTNIAVNLFHEHRRGVTFHPLGPDSAVTDVSAAYEVQRALVTLQTGLGIEPAGYKVGLTSAGLQQLCGINSPLSGVVSASRVHGNNASLALGSYQHLGLEFEIAARLRLDLPPLRAPFDLASVTAAVGEICAAVELIDDRRADYRTLDALSLIADNVWNAGAVLGDFVSEWPELAGAVGIVSRNGIKMDQGSGSDVLGHPFTPLTWLANHLAQAGEGLKAGQIVLTGAFVRPCFPDTAGVYGFEIDGVGSVRVVIQN